MTDREKQLIIGFNLGFITALIVIFSVLWLMELDGGVLVLTPEQLAVDRGIDLNKNRVEKK